MIIGGGAAGLMTAIWAGRMNRARRIVVLDSARKLGAKILVAGGGRCNVTHHEVDERAFAGSSRHAIRKVLRRFDVPRTIEFFRELGVELKREETGKLFPVTDSARTVLEALLVAAAEAGVELVHPALVESVQRSHAHFIVRGEWGTMHCRRLVLATGGRSLPKTGSDGRGYDLARSLGHSITSRVLPALVPLTLPRDHFISAQRPQRPGDARRSLLHRQATHQLHQLDAVHALRSLWAERAGHQPILDRCIDG